MVRTTSTMRLPLGGPAPPFSLPDPDGRVWTLEDFTGALALVVAFVCNHCPYVRHIRPVWAGLARQLQEQGAAVVAVDSNDAGAYPDDAPEAIAREATVHGETFPHLVDASQEVAKAYGAACTPDFFVFDGGGKLAYRGQFDGSRPGNDLPVTGADLRAAVEALLRGEAVPADQQPSLGCNIKWKPGNEPEWFG